MTAMEMPFSEEPLLHPGAVIERLEASCRRVATPCAGGQMTWRSWGSGPLLVLLHGGHGSWLHWIRSIPAFAATRTVLVPDLPGLGDSSDFTGDVPDGIAAIVASGLEQLIVERTPFDLVGFSFGALVAGYVAARLGPQVRSLTLAGPGALGLARPRIELLGWTPDLPPDQLRAIHRTNLLRLMIAHPENLDALALEIQQRNTLRSRVRSRKVANTDALARVLRSCPPKRLNVIWGELDAVAYPHIEERERFIRSLCPGATFHVVPGAGHWVAYEAARQFNSLLAQYLESSPESR
ncbi:Pimeloyl-ACP methyl ester carboxylesterase [Pollutimonas bauzanensis]|uniref:Pimeloyl-ACP methyl ester carboxylesterase n=2 Tax=Pollutimonas bauzanensis TaxID=658167 RepID=A0A1M5R3X1_9BURK|nr:Pimeloyl-ACP methyl ester carboxylesterase [Pollutimonas bauzanensis]